MFRIILIWILFALIAYYIGQTKNRGRDGLLLGLLFGPIGCIWALALSKRTVPGKMHTSTSGKNTSDQITVMHPVSGIHKKIPRSEFKENGEWVLVENSRV